MINFSDEKKLANRNLRPIDVLLLMSGRGSRFTREGFLQRKPFIDVLGFEMFFYPLVSLKIAFGDDIKLHLVTQADDQSLFENAKKRISKVEFNQIVFSKYTTGPVESAIQAIKDMHEPEQEDGAILIHDCDVCYEVNHQQMDIDSDTVVLTTESTNPAYSYLLCDPENGQVLGVFEKQVVSSTAIIGGYLFKSKRYFVQMANLALQKFKNREVYLSDVLSLVIADGKKISELRAKSYWALGTPSELRETEKNQNFIHFRDSKLQKLLRQD